LTLPWPELRSTSRHTETVREILDYIHWVVSALLQLGARSGADQGTWRERTRQAYFALFIPPVIGHGDPYPPDVPPAQSPGIWPDVPAAGVTGMTLRHQLTVTSLLVNQLRTGNWANLRPQEIAEWDRRICRARHALDLGPGKNVPAEARSTPSQVVLADAEARERAIKDDARRRSRQIQRMMSEKPGKKAAPGRAASAKKAPSSGPKSKGKKAAKPKAKAKKR
jgi:hypothetical protein